MIVAVVSESPADEAAIRILVDAVLGVRTEPTSTGFICVRRGWRQILNLVPKILLHTYYQTDARGLVVVLDSNGSPVTAERTGEKMESRLFEMRTRLEQTWMTVTWRAERPQLQTAIGLAAPALEAWLCCGDGKTTEADWIRD